MRLTTHLDVQQNLSDELSAKDAENQMLHSTAKEQAVRAEDYSAQKEEKEVKDEKAEMRARGPQEQEEEMEVSVDPLTEGGTADKKEGRISENPQPPTTLLNKPENPCQREADEPCGGGGRGCVPYPRPLPERATSRVVSPP